MYNLGVYNSFPYNTIPTPTSAAASRDDIQIDDLGLQNDDIVTSFANDDDLPDREIKTESNATIHGEHLLSANWRTKPIVLKGTIHKNSYDELTTFLDGFKKALRKKEINLYIKQADGKTRVYKVILATNGATINRKITVADFSLTLKCLDSFGFDENYTVESYEGVSSLSQDISFETASTEETVAVFVFSFPVAVAVTKVTITNNTNGQLIEVSSAFIANDILKIDGEAILDIVQKNGSQIPSEGEIPDLEVGINSFTIDIEGTSVTYDLTIKYKNNYL